jgi:flagellar L-ring protein precursor FlgH
MSESVSGVSANTVRAGIASRRPIARLAVLTVCAVTLSGCNAFTRLANIGAEPPLTVIEDPTLQKSYKPVTMPMPPAENLVRQSNSLWRPGARQFFKDQRAAKVGDIITINVSIKEKANLSNSTERARTNSESADLTKLFGYEGALDAILPEAVDPTNLASASSDSGSKGSGVVQREEEIAAKIAAIVTQVLPNGNLVVQGRQEVRVNYEMRELQVSGVIRPEDIAATNTINHTQIAEARISYGGRGVISDVQQPRYGQQLFDVVFPW